MQSKDNFWSKFFFKKSEKFFFKVELFIFAYLIITL